MSTSNLVRVLGSQVRREILDRRETLDRRGHEILDRRVIPSDWRDRQYWSNGIGHIGENGILGPTGRIGPTGIFDGTMEIRVTRVRRVIRGPTGPTGPTG
jgi:hypothetical protein